MAQPIKLLICPEAEADLYAYRRRREQGTTVRIIRGRRCAVIDRCMAEWAAALQFPYVFEGTWDSFAECLNELEFPQGHRLLVIVITNLERLLPRAGADFAQLFQVLSDYGIHMKTTPDSEVLEVVVHAEARVAEQVQQRLKNANIEYVPIEAAAR